MSQTLNPNGVDISQLNQELSQLQQSQLQQLQQLQVPHQPSLFRRMLGGITGIAGNMFAPGLGGALGSFIGGTGASSLGASSVVSALGAQSAAANLQLAAAQSVSNSENFAAEQQLLKVAEQSDENQEAVEMASNLEKSKHSTLMSVIQNIGN
jgi:hypothetical protein